MTNTAQANTDREIRVFISSTFRDMHAERDYLVSHVFPVIRRTCRERQVEFTEIDLRWGVTKEEAEQGKVVRICLEEINRCRPYFLSLLGDRYGWAPIDTDLDHKAELLSLFPFLEDSLKAGLSVTEMEILHGVLDNPAMAEHCFFYLRDTALSQSLAESYNVPNDYFETEQHLKDKLTALKDKVRVSGLPVRDNYSSVEALGELIKQDLLAVLDKQFPEDQTPTPLEAEQNAHRGYARDRCQAYIANPRDIEALDTHFNTPTNNALLVTGESGLGKSALLAYWVNQQRLANPDRFIIEHYVGISGDADPVAIIRRIMKEIKHRTDDNAELPSKPEDIIQDFPLWLAKVSERDPLILLIDGLNQLESKDGKWLPNFWQENVKAIFSVILGEQLDQLLQNEWPLHTLETLDLNRREQLIREWLASYRKALSTEQTLRIAQAPQTGNPLFLKTVLEELRIFGYFEHLDERITTLLSADNPQELFILVLIRLENDFGKDIVIQIMQILWAARRGLSETEIAGITGLSRLVISTFLMAIDAHLAKRGGLLNFFHDYLRQAVSQHFFGDKELKINAHIKLAHYFEQQELNNRVTEELPWQWQQAEQWVALKDCISAIPMFEVLYEKDDLELLAYWLTIGDQFDAGECYTDTLNTWESEKKPELVVLAEILSRLSSFLRGRCARLNYAEPLCRRVLAICEKVFGAEHPATATSLNNLAGLLDNQGNYDAAEPLYRRALAIREKVFGAEHPDTASSLDNLAILLGHLGNYDAAEPHYRRALAIREKVFGAEHPDTATSLDNLAILLGDLGNYDAAEPLHRRALVIREKVLGAEHPDTATSLNNLASLLQDQGQYDAAEPLQRRALVISEKVLGAEHPYTANSLNNLAGLLDNQGNYDAAEPLYRRALAIREKVLGAEHPDTATSLNNIASLLQGQGQYDAAEPLHRRALAIREKVFGAEHPDTAASLNNLAVLLVDLGNYDAAEPLYRRALVILEKVFGTEHPDTASSLNNLALLLKNQGNYDAAEPLYRRALVILEKVFGAEHPDTATSLDNLASLLQGQGNYDAAEPLYRRALAIREKVFGAEHPDTASSLSNLAGLLVDLGNYDAAEPLYRRALAISEKVFGAKHPDTANILNNLAVLLVDLGNYDAAEPLYRRALAIREKVLGIEHPYTISSLNNLAVLLRDIGSDKEALKIYQSLLLYNEKNYGSLSHEVSMNCRNIAKCSWEINKLDDAELYFRRELEILKQINGNTHPSTLESVQQLGVFLRERQKYEEAESLLREVIKNRELLSDTDDPEVAGSLNALGLLLVKTNRIEEAITLYTRALVIREEALGADHPQTVLIRDRLSEITNI